MLVASGGLIGDGGRDGNSGYDVGSTMNDLLLYCEHRAHNLFEGQVDRSVTARGLKLETSRVFGVESRRSLVLMERCGVKLQCIST